MNYEIDASNQILGILATKVAVLLRGKNDPAYQPNLLPRNKVLVFNVAKLNFTGRKLKQKNYYHYSGYPGGLRAVRLEVMFAKNPAKVLRLAVYRMLARNRMRDKIIKNLEIK